MSKREKRKFSGSSFPCGNKRPHDLLDRYMIRAELERLLEANRKEEDSLELSYEGLEWDEDIPELSYEGLEWDEDISELSYTELDEGLLLQAKLERLLEANRKDISELSYKELDELENLKLENLKLADRVEEEEMIQVGEALDPDTIRLRNWLIQADQEEMIQAEVERLLEEIQKDISELSYKELDELENLMLADRVEEEIIPILVGEASDPDTIRLRNWLIQHYDLPKEYFDDVLIKDLVALARISWRPPNAIGSKISFHNGQ